MSLLVFVRQELTHITGRDGSRYFMWVDAKHFSMSRDASDAALLQALLGHDQYRDHYAGGGPADQGQHDLHGPYQLCKVLAESFEPTSTGAAEEALRAWLLTEPEVDEASEREHLLSLLSSEVLPLLSHGTIYRLRDLRPDAEHEWGWVVGAGRFHEFVVINRDEGSLTLLVASDD